MKLKAALCAALVLLVAHAQSAQAGGGRGRYGSGRNDGPVRVRVNVYLPQPRVTYVRQQTHGIPILGITSTDIQRGFSTPLMDGVGSIYVPHNLWSPDYHGLHRGG